MSALMLRHAADELLLSGTEQETAAMVTTRIADADRVRFERRLNRLVADYQAAEDPAGERHVLTYAMFRAKPGLPPRSDGA